MNRRDLDMDGAGEEFYSASTEDYISEHAARLRISFDDAAEIYERGVYQQRDTLAEQPTPEDET